MSGKQRSAVGKPIDTATGRPRDDRRNPSSDFIATGEAEIVIRTTGGRSIFGNTSLLEDALLREAIADCLGV